MIDLIKNIIIMKISLFLSAIILFSACASMMAQDEPPSRLERVKQEVRRLRALSPNDRVALVAFAGRSYILTPLTVDDGALELFLDNLDPSIVGQAGSSLARAIRQGTELLSATEGTAGRALVWRRVEGALVRERRRRRDSASPGGRVSAQLERTPDRGRGE